MAILFSKTRKTAPETTNEKYFDLVFTDGTTYDLDKFAKYKDRSNSDAELLIKVIDNKEISNTILNEIMSTFRTTISDIVNDEKVKKEVSNIISNVASRYGIINFDGEIPDIVYKMANNEVNSYLKTLFDTYGINYQVKFFNAVRADISYEFTDTDSMEQLVNERLNFYLTKYKNELTNVEEGSLNITTSGRRRTVGTEDYKKYLLGEEFGKEKSTEGFTPSVTGRRPIIMWEEGSPDITEDGEEAIDIYEELESLRDEVDKHSEILNNELLGKFQISEVEVGAITSMSNDLSDIDGFGLIEQHVILL